MSPQELKDRTKSFAVRIMKLTDALSGSVGATVIGKQIVRSGTSVAANYRSALRARSKPEFISKLNVVIEECDETLFWLELIIDSGLIKRTKIENLYQEANELLSIFCATQKTTKIRNQKSEIRNRK